MMDEATIGLDEVERLEKRGIRFAERFGVGSVHNTERPLEGITSKQRIRTRKAGDVLNIGAGHSLHGLWHALLLLG